MNYRTTILFLLCTLVFSAALTAQSTHKKLRRGDKAYRSNDWNNAEMNYRDASGESDKGTYNLANSLYQQKRFEEAVNQYEKVTGSGVDPDIRDQALFNLGNAHFQLENYEESVEAYKKLLERDPENEEALKNLWEAWRKIVKQQQQQQEQQQSSESDQPQGEEGDQQPQQYQNDQFGEGPPKPESYPSAEELSDRDAEDLLRIVEQEDQKTQEKLQAANKNQRKPKKDW
jgi:tetratricopeptide (TPR) repeat protein